MIRSRRFLHLITMEPEHSISPDLASTDRPWDYPAVRCTCAPMVTCAACAEKDHWQRGKRGKGGRPRADRSAEELRAWDAELEDEESQIEQRLPFTHPPQVRRKLTDRRRRIGQLRVKLRQDPSWPRDWEVSA